MQAVLAQYSERASWGCDIKWLTYFAVLFSNDNEKYYMLLNENKN